MINARNVRFYCHFTDCHLENPLIQVISVVFRYLHYFLTLVRLSKGGQSIL
jgi:hypothetical protein